MIQVLQKAGHVHQDVDQYVLEIFWDVLPRDALPFGGADHELLSFSDCGKGLWVVSAGNRSLCLGGSTYQIYTLIREHIVSFALGVCSWCSCHEQGELACVVSMPLMRWNESLAIRVPRVREDLSWKD